MLAAAERLHQNPQASLWQLTGAYYKKLVLQEDQRKVSIEIKENDLELSISTYGKGRRLFFENLRLGKAKTRENIATIIHIADELIAAEHTPARLTIDLHSLLGRSSFVLVPTWILSMKDLFRVGFQNGRHLSIALRKPSTHE